MNGCHERASACQNYTVTLITVLTGMLQAAHTKFSLYLKIKQNKKGTKKTSLPSKSLKVVF